MHCTSACLLIEPGWCCLSELPLLVEGAGFVPTGGPLAEAAKQAWAFAILVVSAETQGSAKNAVEKLAGQDRIPVLLALPDPESVDVAQLLAAGAADFISPPFTPATVVPRIQRLMQTRAGRGPEPQPGLPAELGLLGRSPAFLAEMQKLPAISRCDVTVTIAGETGTGKELVARAIHSLSGRRENPFVPVDCGAIPQELAESELFGHEKGSFTGAAAKTTGLIGSANRGTLFLDEVDSLSAAIQAKLLRFLQRREYRAIGSATLQHADVRVIAATNADLRQRVTEGRFREDLFYRLKVVNVHLPPLRERGEDVLLLAQHFVVKYAARFQRRTRGLSRDAVARLISHPWPGNVREVENVIEAAVALSEGEWLAAPDIAFDGMEASSSSLREAKARVVHDFERTYIVRLLRAYEGNISEAARAAKKNRRAFWELMRKYKVRPEDYCDAAKLSPGREGPTPALAASG